MCRSVPILILSALLVSPALAAPKKREAPIVTEPAPPPPRLPKLAQQGSPYLVQHADNLVDWLPWGDEAFARARKEGKPIFLSIGYASCHWCHVMERESFLDAKVAALINGAFVPVLVDREERADVDATYLTFVQTMNDGRAGWPANLVLTPDLEPLVGTSYLSKAALEQLLSDVAQKWASDRASLFANAAQVLAAARASAQDPAAAGPAVASLVERTFTRYRELYDRQHGGFGTGAPKFPQPLAASFLLRYGARQNSGSAQEMATKTLQAMANGAIHDHVGGGFHRYTVDGAWKHPHFEKMLYDQALLAMAYTEAFQATGDASYRRVARRALDFAIRDMRQSGGGFDSARDAESLTWIPGRPGVLDGVFYVWDHGELTRLLGKDRAAIVTFHFGVKESGNVPEFLTDIKGLNLIGAEHAETITQQKFGLTKAQLDEHLFAALDVMQKVRSKRPPPARDHKAIAGWNGLMMSALARAGAVFEEPHYVAAAADIARFAQAKLWDAKTKTLRRHASGPNALTEDYAYLVQGLLDLYEATFSIRYLELAMDLQQRQDELFWDAAKGRYDNGSTLPPALRDVAPERDAPLPSFNAVAASNVLRLGEMVDSAPWRTKAEAIFRSFSARMQSNPADLPHMASVMAASLAPPIQVVITGDPIREETKAMLRAANRYLLPRRALFFVVSDGDRKKVAQYAPYIAEMKPVDEKPTAYVCEHYTCRPPVNDPGKLEGMLGNLVRVQAAAP